MNSRLGGANAKKPHPWRNAWWPAARGLPFFVALLGGCSLGARTDPAPSPTYPLVERWDAQQSALWQELTAAEISESPDCRRVCALVASICELADHICALHDPSELRALQVRCGESKSRCVESRKRGAARCQCDAH